MADPAIKDLRFTWPRSPGSGGAARLPGGPAYRVLFAGVSKSESRQKGADGYLSRDACVMAAGVTAPGKRDGHLDPPKEQHSPGSALLQTAGTGVRDADP